MPEKPPDNAKTQRPSSPGAKRTQPAKTTKGAGATKGPTTSPSSGNAARRASQKAKTGTSTGATKSSSRPGGQAQTRAPGPAPPRNGPAGAARGSGARKAAQRASAVAPGARRVSGVLSPAMGWAVALGALLLTVADGLKLSTSDFMPQLAVLFVLGAAGLPLLVVRAIGPSAGERTRSETWAARAGIAFVVAALVSTVLSIAPGIAVVGTYGHGTGWLFIASVAGCWAIGTGLSGDQRGRVELFLIAGAVVNGLVAVLQQFVGLSSIGLPLYDNQPDGLLGNPVFLGAVMAASLVLVAPRFFARPKQWWWVVVILGFSLGISAERFPALLALVVVGWLIVGAWRARQGADEPAHPFRAWWQPSVALGGITVVSMVVGSLLARAAGGLGIVSHTASSTGQETYGQRFDAWVAAAHALVVKPLFGWGPGQFEAATSNRFSLPVARQLGTNVFPDAHNFIVEYAATTGVVGLACLVAWLVFALRHRGGYLLGFALVIFASQLVEPLNAATTGVGFLALGGAVLRLSGSRSSDAQSGGSARPAEEAGATKTDGPHPVPGWVRIAMPVMAVVVAVPSLVLVIGDMVLQQSYIQSRAGNVSQAASTAKTADTLLFHAWPEPAFQLAQAEYALGTHGETSQLPVAAQWAETAADRSPTNSLLWLTAAQFRAANLDLSAAYQDGVRAQRYLPYDTDILNLLAETAAEQHHNAAAISWLQQSLAVDPTQSALRVQLKKLQEGCVTKPITMQNPQFVLVCPHAGQGASGSGH